MIDSEDQLTRSVIGLAMRIHSQLGPGLFESVCKTVLAGKLSENGHQVERQKAIEIEFEGMRFPNAFKVDLLFDQRLIIEIKATEINNALHARQLLTYLRVTGLTTGLVINFNVLMLRDGIKRVVNSHVAREISANSALSA